LNIVFMITSLYRQLSDLPQESSALGMPPPCRVEEHGRFAGTASFTSSSILPELISKVKKIRNSSEAD